MPFYQINVRCPHCSEHHPVKNVLLARGPAQEQSVGEFYAAGRVPSGLATVTTNYLFCPRTKNWFLQKDRRQVMLVPVERPDPSLGIADESAAAEEG